MRRGKYPFIIGFLAVPVTLYVVFVVAAYVQTFQLAFTEWSGIGPVGEYTLNSFRQLWNDDLFWRSVRHNLFLLLAFPLLTIIIALVFAFLLNVGGGTKGGVTRGVTGSWLYRVLFFFPQLLALAIVAVIFGRVFSPDDSGMINGLLPDGWDPILFLADKNLAMLCILAVLTWQAVGFYVVLFSAGMGSISQEIYEAAELDGATRLTLFFRITVPLLWNTIQVAWVYLGIAAFDAFALVNIMSVERGGPDGATSVLSLMIYRNAFEFGQAGYASALGVSLFILTLAFAALTLRVTRRDAVEL